MKLRLCLAVLVATGVLAHRAQSQSSAASVSPIGVWRGTSKCLVTPSPCNDEITVYRIVRTKKADSVSLDALKIVNGQEDDMGALACKVGAQGSSLTCAMPNGVWLFAIRGDSLIGELRKPDNTKFRDVRAVRSH